MPFLQQNPHVPSESDATDRDISAGEDELGVCSLAVIS
jgi:hypothetical protein